jgi:3-oxoacyl-[acyl-carrier protein] reductase
MNKADVGRRKSDGKTVTTSAETPVALVTGSARRLGRAIALRLAASGHFVFIHYLGSKREADAVLTTIRATGGDGVLVTGDLSKASGVNAIVRSVKSTLAKPGMPRRLDVLVNNVGVYKVGPLLDFSADDFDVVLRANLTGCFRLIQSLLPLVQPGANIVNIGYAGVDNLTSTTHNTAYLISKSGLLILTKSLAQALGPRGVRVNMVSPGILSNSVELPKKASDFIPMGFLGEVDDVANAVDYLVSDKARYITGVNLDVAGGYHMALRSLETGVGASKGDLLAALRPDRKTARPTTRRTTKKPKAK